MGAGCRLHELLLALAPTPEVRKTSLRAPYLVKGHKATHGVNDRLEDLDAFGVKLVLVGAIGLNLRDGVGERARGVERVEVVLALLAQSRLLGTSETKGEVKSCERRYC